MKKIFITAFAVLLPFVFTMCSTSGCGSSITVAVTGGNGKDLPVLYLPDGSNIEIELSAEGRGTITVDNSDEIYVRIGYGYKSYPVWLVPGADIEISFNGTKGHENIVFEGTSDDINTFINSNSYKFATINDTGYEESEFVSFADSLLKRNLELLNDSGFPRSFVEKESARLVYYTYQTLPSYGYFHPKIAGKTEYSESEFYFGKLKELLVYRSEYMISEDYRKFLAESVAVLSKKDFPNLKGIERLVAFIDKEITDKSVAEYLVNRRVCSFIKKNGLENSESYMTAFNKFVTDKKLVNEFEQLKQKMKKCSVGEYSPDFKCSDIDGRQYTLSDFKGKYVYIDVWATWCGPCRREAPHLLELERKFEGKGVSFVSISCDANKAAWEKAVRNGTASGIQLYLESGNTFMDDYSITGIPRFILLDKEGRIINAKMSAPSDLVTAEVIGKLVGSGV